MLHHVTSVNEKPAAAVPGRVGLGSVLPMVVAWTAMEIPGVLIPEIVPLVLVQGLSVLLCC